MKIGGSGVKGFYSLKSKGSFKREEHFSCQPTLGWRGLWKRLFLIVMFVLTVGPSFLGCFPIRVR